MDYETVVTYIGKHIANGLGVYGHLSIHFAIGIVCVGVHSQFCVLFIVVAVGAAVVSHFDARVDLLIIDFIRALETQSIQKRV